MAHKKKKAAVVVNSMNKISSRPSETVVRGAGGKKAIDLAHSRTKKKAGKARVIRAAGVNSTDRLKSRTGPTDKHGRIKKGTALDKVMTLQRELKSAVGRAHTKDAADKSAAARATGKNTTERLTSKPSKLQNSSFAKKAIDARVAATQTVRRSVINGPSKAMRPGGAGSGIVRGKLKGQF